MQLNGLMLTLDTPSVLWINLFCLDLCRSLEQFKAIYKLEDSGRRDEHVDVRLDGFRLKVPFFSFLSQSSVFSLRKEHETSTWLECTTRRQTCCLPLILLCLLLVLVLFGLWAVKLMLEFSSRINLCYSFLTFLPPAAQHPRG